VCPRDNPRHSRQRLETRRARGNPLFTIGSYHCGHGIDPSTEPAGCPDVARSRCGLDSRRFACLFSTADEYETALIAERRAQGRYTQGRSYWPVGLFLGCALVVAGTVLLFA
jgi:hypothetical protein